VTSGVAGHSTLKRARVGKIPNSIPIVLKRLRILAAGSPGVAGHGTLKRACASKIFQKVFPRFLKGCGSLQRGPRELRVTARLNACARWKYSNENISNALKRLRILAAGSAGVAGQSTFLYAAHAAHEANIRQSRNPPKNNGILKQHVHEGIKTSHKSGVLPLGLHKTRALGCLGAGGAVHPSGGRC